MKLSEYIDTAKLQRHVSNGLVTARRHNTLPLTIYCYGKTAVFNRVWDDVTTKTRGLIVDDSGEIIARPYEKFFSIDQLPTLVDVHEIDTQFGPPVITEKVNGCLGIFWKYGIHWGIASKGSFHSPHAEFATKWMEQHIEEHGPLVFPEGYTPVFEIVCQEVQPHVIKYAKDGLVLLSFVKVETGEEGDRAEVVNYYGNLNSLDRAFSFNGTLDEALSMDREHYEGLVATYNIPGQAPFKLKIKFPTFLKNRKAFYEAQRLKSDDGGKEAYNRIHSKAAEIVKEALVVCTEQKEFAMFFQKPENVFYAPACFAMLNYDEDKDRQKRAIWRLVDKEKNAS
jgi:RNA ligase